MLWRWQSTQRAKLHKQLQQRRTSGVSIRLPVSGSKWRAFQLKLNDIPIRPHSPLSRYYTQYGGVRYPVSKTEVTAVLFNQSQNRACYGLQILFKPSNLFLFIADYPPNGPWGMVNPSMTPSLLVKLPSFRGSLLPPSSRTNNKYFFTVVQQPPVGQGHPTFEDKWSHSDTPHSVGLLWTSNQPDAETSTGQHTTLTRDRHPSPWRDSNQQSQQASGRRPTP